jgi:hypothetical protein
MVISLETPVHPEISSAAEGAADLSIQLDRILYQIEEIPTTVLRKKNSTDNFSTLITIDHWFWIQSNQNLH